MCAWYALAVDVSSVRGSSSWRRLLLVGMTALLFACTWTRSDQYLAAGRESLCAQGFAPLGVVAVLPETAWRFDQKERAKREAMIERAIAKAFADLPCGSLAPPGGVEPLAVWSIHSEQALLASLANRGIDSAVIVRVEELTPRLAITFSLPFLWGSSSEADFRIRALDTRHATVLADFRVKRVVGGFFQLRPPSWAEPELATALRRSITGIPAWPPKMPSVPAERSTGSATR